MIYLREVRRKRSGEAPGYPLNTPILRGLDTLPFTASVTILCGDNGSGKTTLLGLLAALLSAQAVGSAGVGEERMRLFRAAARCFIPVMARRPRSCFFFTAEDFSRYLDDRQRMRGEAQQALMEIEEAFAGRDEYAKSLARMPHARALQEMAGQYDRELAQSSHGEGFLSFFGGRLTRGGLYLLDEPEGALSYQNQLSLMALISRAVEAEGQVILATHSPVLAAYPQAALLEVSAGGLEAVAYEGLSSVQFLQHFMKHRTHILRSAGIWETPTG